MLVQTVLVAAVVASAPLGAADIEVSAKIGASALTVGGEYALVVDVSLPEGVSAAKAGLPAPLLQLDVPACVALSGEHLTKYEQLARNEFLEAPFEQMLDSEETSIGFKLVATPSASDAISVNVIAYATDSSGDSLRFIRKRLRLPVAPNATATPVAADRSRWGTNKTLAIGDTAADFSLPKLTGGSASLAKFRGKKNVIVTTYRAHW